VATMRLEVRLCTSCYLDKFRQTRKTEAARGVLCQPPAFLEPAPAPVDSNSTVAVTPRPLDQGHI